MYGFKWNLIPAAVKWRDVNHDKNMFEFILFYCSAVLLAKLR